MNGMNTIPGNMKEGVFGTKARRYNIKTPREKKGPTK